jgi:hypothetical protein
MHIILTRTLRRRFFWLLFLLLAEALFVGFRLTDINELCEGGARPNGCRAVSLLVISLTLHAIMCISSGLLYLEFTAKTLLLGEVLAYLSSAWGAFAGISALGTSEVFNGNGDDPRDVPRFPLLRVGFGALNICFALYYFFYARTNGRAKTDVLLIAAMNMHEHHGEAAEVAQGFGAVAVVSTNSRSGSRIFGDGDSGALERSYGPVAKTPEKAGGAPGAAAASAADADAYTLM